MKLFYSPLAVLCLATTILLPVAHAEVSPFKVRVEMTSKSDSEKDKTTQTRILNFIVDNTSGEAADLKVKYAVFGRDVTSKDIVTLGQGELPVSVKPRGTEKLTAPKVEAVVTEPKPAKGQAKKVDPSGQKMVGHGVQVLKGDTVVAEAYEPASIKESFGKAAAAKPAAAPAKK